MRRSDWLHNCRTFYRPIEAATRWSGLERFEPHILEVLGARNIPSPEEFPRWPTLRLNVERIFDAMRNRELPYGRTGITCNDPSLLDDPQLTVRHIDLRAWMTRFYPGQKPAFLFDDIERQRHPVITIEAVQALLVDREALRSQLADHQKEIEDLRKEIKRQGPSERVLLPRSETTYLNIVGGLLTLLLGKSPTGTPYSSFETMEAVISALIAHHEGRPGISERTLWAKFAAAKRQLGAT
ncbi:MAG: ATP-binding protein [Thauera sp.]|nr:ATP-binding protein [Thauera sp.]